MKKNADRKPREPKVPIEDRVMHSIDLGKKGKLILVNDANCYIVGIMKENLKEHSYFVDLPSALQHMVARAGKAESGTLDEYIRLIRKHVEDLAQVCKQAGINPF